MPKKIWSTLIVGLIFLLLFTSCERPASTVPVGTPSGVDAFPTPLPVDQQILDSTQTAQALMEQFNQPTPTSGEVPAETVTEEATPLPSQTLTPTGMPPTPVVTLPATYTLHEGEFPYCLARRFGIDVADILAVNGLTESSLLSAGMSLIMPQNSTWPGGERALHAHPDTYTVSSGETVYSIACYYGDVTPEAIIAVNGLQEPYMLKTGQVLQIP